MLEYIRSVFRPVRGKIDVKISYDEVIDGLLKEPKKFADKSFREELLPFFLPVLPKSRHFSSNPEIAKLQNCILELKPQQKSDFYSFFHYSEDELRPYSHSDREVKFYAKELPNVVQKKFFQGKFSEKESRLYSLSAAELQKRHSDTSDVNSVGNTGILPANDRLIVKRFGNQYRITIPAEMTKKRIAFSGGGAKGVAYLGVIQALGGNLKYVEEVAGASIGSFFAALVACALTAKEIEEALKNVNLQNALSGKLLNKNDAFVKAVGFIIDCKIRNVVRKEFHILESKIRSMEIDDPERASIQRLLTAVKERQGELHFTFDQLRILKRFLPEYGFKNLAIPAVSAETHSPILFTTRSTKDAVICETVGASSSLPFIFEAPDTDLVPYFGVGREIIGKLQDGGIENNNPFSAFTDLDPSRNLALSFPNEMANGLTIDGISTAWAIQEKLIGNRDFTKRSLYEIVVPVVNKFGHVVDSGELGTADFSDSLKQLESIAAREKLRFLRYLNGLEPITISGEIPDIFWKFDSSELHLLQKSKRSRDQIDFFVSLDKHCKVREQLYLIEKQINALIAISDNIFAQINKTEVFEEEARKDKALLLQASSGRILVEEMKKHAHKLINKIEEMLDEIPVDANLDLVLEYLAKQFVNNMAAKDVEILFLLKDRYVEGSKTPLNIFIRHVNILGEKIGLQWKKENIIKYEILPLLDKALKQNIIGFSGLFGIRSRFNKDEKQHLIDLVTKMMDLSMTFGNDFIKLRLEFLLLVDSKKCLVELRQIIGSAKVSEDGKRVLLNLFDIVSKDSTKYFDKMKSLISSLVDYNENDQASKVRFSESCQALQSEFPISEPEAQKSETGCTYVWMPRM